MVLFKIPWWIQKLLPAIIWRKASSEREVFLTFDDGPNPEVTPWVLDLLDRYQAKATFFCLGKQVEKHGDIFNEIISRGHETGSHTYSHADAFKIPVDEYLQEVRRGAYLVGNNLFRPPYGHLTPKVYFKLKSRYRIVLWDVMSYDFDSSLDSGRLLMELKQNTEAGSIIVFHDSVKAFPQLKIILPQYLQWLREKNFFCNKFF